MLFALTLLFQGPNIIFFCPTKCSFTSSGLFPFVSGTSAKTYRTARAAKAAKRKYVPEGLMASCLGQKPMIRDFR